MRRLQPHRSRVTCWALHSMSPALTAATRCSLASVGLAAPDGPRHRAGAAEPTVRRGRRPEPADTLDRPEGDYPRAVAPRHPFPLPFEFIEDVAEKCPPTDPLNDLKLEAEILFTVRWDGSPAEVTSPKLGRPAFDLRPPWPWRKGTVLLRVPPDPRLRRQRRRALPLGLRPRLAPLLGRRGPPGRGAAGRGAPAAVLFRGG